MITDPGLMIADLIHKGRQAQLIYGDIDWAQSAHVPRWMTRRKAIWLVSQLRYGELATARMCLQVGNTLGSAPAEAFLRTQLLDEIRHAGLFDRYLEKLGGSAELSAELCACYDRALAWNGPPHAIMLAFHVLLEGENLRLQTSAETWTACPLLRSISAHVARDEARHVAFGRIFLRHALPQLPQRARVEIYRWLRSLWHDAVAVVLARLIPPRLLGRGSMREFTTSTWRERYRDLEGAGLFSTAERPHFRAS